MLKSYKNRNKLYRVVKILPIMHLKNKQNLLKFSNIFNKFIFIYIIFSTNLYIYIYIFPTLHNGIVMPLHLMALYACDSCIWQ